MTDTTRLIDGFLWWSGLATWGAIAVFVLLVVCILGLEFCKSARMTFIYFRNAKRFKLDKWLLHRMWFFITLTWQGATSSNMEVSWRDEEGNHRWVKWKANQ